MMTNKSAAVSAIELEDGTAEPMGHGMFRLLQRDETMGGAMQRVTVSREDLTAMRTYENALSSTLKPVKLRDGRAHYMGEGTFVIDQKDETQPWQPYQRLVIYENDVDMLLRSAA